MTAAFHTPWNDKLETGSMRKYQVGVCVKGVPMQNKAVIHV